MGQLFRFVCFFFLNTYTQEIRGEKLKRQNHYTVLADNLKNLSDIIQLFNNSQLLEVAYNYPLPNGTDKTTNGRGKKTIYIYKFFPIFRHITHEHRLSFPFYFGSLDIIGCMDACQLVYLYGGMIHFKQVCWVK